jgi:hypothetical protein
MKKIICMVLGLVFLVGCSSTVSTNETKKESKQEAEKQTETTGLANPFVTCQTMEEAKTVAGFEMSYPESVLDSSTTLLQAMEASMIQVIYNDSSDNEILRIRKSTSTDDITGDYETYVDEFDEDFDGVSVHVKGGNGEYIVMSWNVDEYQYCVLAQNHPLTQEEFKNVLENVH